MPRAIPSIPDPTTSTPGVSLTFLVKGPGQIECAFNYPPDPGGAFVVDVSSTLTASQRTALAEIANAMITAFRAQRGYTT